MIPKRPRRETDHEGRPESAGPLFDAAALEAQERRDLGMARAELAAERHAPGWEDDAVAHVTAYALTHELFLAEDARAGFHTPEGVDGRAWGSVIKRAQALGVLRPHGFAAANSSNRSPKVLWKSLVFEGKDKP